VRGVGLIHSMDQIRDTMITAVNGVAVRIRDVAVVTVGHQPQRAEAEVEKINNSNILPPGVRIERIYDRKDLINITTRTVVHNMVFGIVLIFFVQRVFLGNFRSALIVATTIPFALSFAITILVLRRIGKFAFGGRD
jgi:cobalt-zinc-cadmium resistance protein CzcA